MSREEFKEKFANQEIPNWLREPIDVETIWQWIKEEIKTAKINENKKWIKIIKKHGTWSQTSMGFTVNDFNCRVKELKSIK